MPPPSSRRNILLLAIFNFLRDFRLYGPVMIIYFQTITQSFALAMSVLSLTMLAAAALEVPTGIFSDRIGRKWTVVLGAVASCLSVMCYAIGGTYVMLLIGAFFEGLGRSLFSGNNDALLHDTLVEIDKREEYEHHLGRVSSAYQVAMATSAVIGSMLAAISFGLVMWLSVVPQLMLVAVSLRFVEPQIHTEGTGNVFAHLREALHNIVHNRRLRMLSIGQILLQLNEAAFQFRVVFIETLWPMWAIGVSRTLSYIGAAVSFYFAGPLLRRFGEKHLLFGGVTLSELTNLIALLLNSVLSPLMMGATSIFFGANSVSLNGMMQREFTDAQRSTMGSLASLGGSLFFAVVSVVIGWLADTIGIREALIGVTLLSLTPLIFFRLAFRHSSVREPALDVALTENKG